MIVECVTFLPLIILVNVFKKTKRRSKKSVRLQKIFQKNNGHDSIKKSSSKANSKANSKGKQTFKFPWYFKIILFAISFFSMGLSIAFVLFKGEVFILLNYLIYLLLF